MITIRSNNATRVLHSIGGESQRKFHEGRQRERTYTRHRRRKLHD